jgi:hypothetical protein
LCNATPAITEIAAAARSHFVRAMGPSLPVR